MVGDTHDLSRLDASRLLLKRQSSELHGLLILLELDGRQGTLLGSLSVHEIASSRCHFDLGSVDVVNVPLVDGTAAFLREIGLRGFLEVGLH